MMRIFYAAFELRCGIEARMRQYLEAWDDADRKIKIGWRMADLLRSLENAFRIGNSYARYAVHDATTGDLRVCIYYTPVTPALKKTGEQLGDYLHVFKNERLNDTDWWAQFRALLKECASLLRTATSGIMIEPALRNGPKQIHMQLEISGEIDKQALLRAMGSDGEIVATHVSYSEMLPEKLEPQAVMLKD